jgi:cullin-associated NEDD8-dissociated protein 1
VQSLADKCLSPLVPKEHEERDDENMTSLCSHVLTATEEQRDICSIGLKTVVLEMPSTMAASAIRQLTPQLIKGVRRDVLEVKLECLEVLNDLLRRFAATLTESESRDCLAALFGELTSSRAAARKRSIACIASLSASLPDRMLDGQLVGAILSQLNATNVKMDLRRTYIQTLSAISRSGGYRLAKQVDKVIPLILQQCMPAASNGNGDPEMIESCLQAFESFVLRCPKEVSV